MFTSKGFNNLPGDQINQNLFYQTLISDSLDGIIVTDILGNIKFSAPSITRILGYVEQEILSKNIFDYTYPEDRSIAYSSFEDEVKMVAKKKFISIRVLKNNGEYIWCTIRGHNMLQNPNVQGLVIYFTDDTQLREIENKLQKSEEQFRHLINNLKQGVVIQNSKAEIILSNPAAHQMLGLREDKFMGASSFDKNWDVIYEDGTIVNGDEHPGPLAIKTKKPVKDLVLGVQNDITNQRVWLLINADPTLDSEGNVINVIVSYTDITERKRKIQHFFMDEIQNQRQLTKAMIFGQEKERREIGKELHDNINQHLTTTRLFLEVAKEKATGEVLNLITQSHKTLTNIVNEIRILSQSLVPPSLGDIGLVESVEELCSTLKLAHKFDIHFIHPFIQEAQLSANMKLMLFRIIQEQISNIIRHAQANSVTLKLQKDAELLTLIITDDGKGFDLQDYKKGLGFNNIINRAELFSGKVNINAAPGKGCTITVEIPFMSLD